MELYLPYCVFFQYFEMRMEIWFVLSWMNSGKFSAGHLSRKIELKASKCYWTWFEASVVIDLNFLSHSRNAEFFWEKKIIRILMFCSVKLNLIFLSLYYLIFLWNPRFSLSLIDLVHCVHGMWIKLLKFVWQDIFKCNCFFVFNFLWMYERFFESKKLVAGPHRHRRRRRAGRAPCPQGRTRYAPGQDRGHMPLGGCLAAELM